MRVQEIMRHPVITAGKDTPLNEVAALMLKHQIGCVPIVGKKGELLGVITETDFMPRLRNLPFSTYRMPYLLGHWLPMEGSQDVYTKVGNLKAKDLMSACSFTAKEEDLTDYVVAEMLERQMHHVPVLRGNLLVGIVTRHDMLRAYLRQTKAKKSKVVKKVAERARKGSRSKA